MQKVALIDRDATMIEEPADFQIDSVDKFKLLPKTITGLKALSNLGFSLIMITNQDGLGSKGYPKESYDEIQKLLLGILESEGIFFDEIYMCPHFDSDNCQCRKPLLGMLPSKLIQEIDRETSVVIGDRKSDLEMARNLGVRGVLIEGDWEQVITDVINQDILIKRKTKETNISLILSEYSKEICIETPVGFFTHMLETFTRFSGLGIKLQASGDTYVDYHHLVEDVAIVIGEGLSKLRKLNPNRNRFSNTVVMDEAKCQMTLDFGGRIFLSNDFSFRSAFIGDFPTEMINHFFKSLCDNAQISLHIELNGENDHHLAEVLFKTFGMVLKEAISSRNIFDQKILSTKGSL